MLGLSGPKWTFTDPTAGTETAFSRSTRVKRAIAPTAPERFKRLDPAGTRKTKSVSIETIVKRAGPVYAALGQSSSASRERIFH